MDLKAEVTSIKGIGTKTAETLNKAGIKIVRDLLYNLPRDYENYQATTNLSDIKPGKVVIKGKIDTISTKYTRRRNFTITEAVIRDETAAVRAIWFNQAYRVKQFDKSREYFFTGNYELKAGRYQLTNPSATLATDVDDANEGLHPIYVARGGLKSHDYHKFIKSIKTEFYNISDLIPDARPKLRADSLYKTHFPETDQDVKTARRYLAYEELYCLLLAANLSKQENQKLKSAPLKFSQKNIKEALKTLPFTLTNGQKRALWDILQDLEKSTPMNRLLQGDVGSGKTIVAALTALQAIQNGSQVALLAPTAILATQHAEGLEPLLRPLGVKIALLTGSTKHKTELKRELKQGNIDLLIGTHAIITDDTEFKNLNLCIIDEQHRFGVAQRQKLLLKSPGKLAPHLLSMTATPIPRSLQLTLFGDLDVSIISELPKGRQPIETKIMKQIDEKDYLFPEIKAEIDKKHQIYWVCKAIDDNPETETKSVKKQTKKLQEIFPRYKIEFLHGKMKPAEKDEIMGKFASGKIDILVSTTVIEVGVNVPNASVMVIEDAENYGLAQLHQLRGRVGRGSTKSFCYLITDADKTPSRRLKELEVSTDGFYLAEVDLKLRGPGEIYGSLQHGALDLRIATLADTKLIASASKAAKAFAAKISQNPELMLKYQELAGYAAHYQQLTILN